MTDNEIIKALECCAEVDECEECPLCEGCNRKVFKDALDLINRQKAIIEKSEKVEHFADKAIETANAEIERLNIELQSMRSAANSYKMHYVTAKSEAIKEFAERLKEEIICDTAYGCDCNQHSGYYDYKIKIGDIPEYIDDIVKKLTEDI